MIRIKYDLNQIPGFKSKKGNGRVGGACEVNVVFCVRQKWSHVHIMFTNLFFVERKRHKT